jgi:hypothetical protein
MMPIALFPIWNKKNPVRKQCLEAGSDLEGHHFNAGMASMAKYVQYLLNLQHNIDRTIMQQCMRLTTYDEHNTAISHELEQLKHENALLCSSTLPSSDPNRELKVAYRLLCEVKHKWNYTRQQLDAAREVVDERTHAIIHLEHTNEQQDLKLDKRVVVIASIEQKLQVPLAPIDPAEPDVMSDVDEE